MKISHYTSMLFVVFLMICVMSTVFAAPVSVVVQNTEGSVMTRESGDAQWIPVSNGDTLSAGAAVRTGAGSSCILKWASGNIMKIKPLTNIAISKLDSDGSGSENSSLDLKNGKINVHVEKLKTNSSSFTVQTPTAVAGVRGTALFIDVSENKAATFGVTEGAIYVESGGVETVVSEDFMVTVSAEGVVSLPEIMPVDIKQEAAGEIKQARQATQVELIKGKDEGKKGSGAQGKGQGDEKGKGLDKQDNKKDVEGPDRGKGEHIGREGDRQEDKTTVESETTSSLPETSTNETVELADEPVVIDVDTVLENVVENVIEQNSAAEEQYKTGQFDMYIYIQP